MKTTIEKSKLLEILKENRTKHRAAFEEALTGYRQKKIEELEVALEEARKGVRYFSASSLVQPVDQTRHYDRAIRMLELDVEKDVVLDENQFDNFVMDRWSWSRGFVASNKSYVSSVNALSYMDSIENDQ